MPSNVSTDSWKLKQESEVTEILKYALYSDYVVINYDQKEIPLNIMIVAPPGTGKTAMVEQFVENNGVMVFGKITEHSLLDKYLEDLKASHKRLLIPDMVNPANMKADTVNSLITFLNSYISWEGVRTISHYGGHFPIALRYPLRGSLMTTMATNDFQRMFRSLAATGFASRLVIVGYFYKRDTVREIMLNLAYHKHKWLDIKLNLPQDRQYIEADGKYTERLIPTAMKLGEIVPGYDIRAMQQMKLMCKSRALMEGRTKINGEDVERVLYLFKTYALKVPNLDAETRMHMSESYKKEQGTTEL